MGLKLRLREAYFIRKTSLDAETQRLLRKKYTFYFFEDKACKDCEEFMFRQNSKTGALCERCKECAAFLGGAELCTSVKIGDHFYLSVPSGDGEELQKFLRKRGYEDLELISLAKDHPIDPISFTGTLRDYQQEAVQAMEEKKRGVVCLAPRSGKCVGKDTVIMTSKGLLPVRKLFENYKLSTANESIFDVENLTIATYRGERDVSYLYSKIVDEVITLRTKSGYELEATPNHPIMVLTKDLDFVWKPLAGIVTSDVLVMSRREQWLPTSTPTFTLLPSYKISGQDKSPEQVMPREMSEELAELLGFWVANGYLHTSLLLTTYSNVIRQRFTECFNKVFPKSGLRTVIRDNKEIGVAVSKGSKQIHRFLEQTVGLCMGVAKEKAIPDVLLKGDRKYLDAFLRAYISCDSYITKNEIELCTASHTLATQLHNILPYYGVRAHLTHKVGMATNGHRIYRSYYRLYIRKRDSQLLLSTLNHLYKEHDLNLEPLDYDHSIYPFVPQFLNSLHKENKSVRYAGYYELKNRDEIRIRDCPLHKRFLKKGLFKKDSKVTRAIIDGVNEETLKKLATKEQLLNWALATDPNVFYDKVTEIKHINTPTRVYDLCVPNGHHYIANTFVSHNTVIGTAFICKTQQKTMVLASQREWLMGFKETFLGSKTQPGFTSLDPSRIGFCKTLEDFNKYDICLVTVQTLHSEHGQVLLNKIKNYFGCVIVDEVHGGAAPKYIQVLNKLNCTYKIGLSGTPDRKDGRYVLVRHVVGPIVYEKKVKQLVPTVELTKTEFSKVAPKNGIWAYIVGPLEKDLKRQRLIAKKALEDVGKGHMVLIPYTTVKAIQTQVEIINKLAGKEVAKAFYGGIKKEERDQIIEDSRTYKLKIIVGNIRLLSTGLNLPRASALFEVTCSSNGPQAVQRFSRILTPWEDKPDPIIRYFLDDYNVRRQCMSNEFWNCLWVKFRPKISATNLNLLKQYFAKKNSFKLTLGRKDFGF